LCHGAVVLFKRKNSKRWQARIRRSSGEWIVYSTKQKDIEQAAAVAEEKYRDIQYAQRTGRIDVTLMAYIGPCRQRGIQSANVSRLFSPQHHQAQR
jgi:hypothetical protein